MGKRLYVGNLNYTTDADALRAAFEEDGSTVTDVHIVLDRETGRPRGFAFVEMSTDEQAVKAAETWDGKELEGRALRVNEAQERQPRAGGGGGGGGGGGFRGGRGGGGGGGFGGGGRGGGGGGRGGRDFSEERW